MAMPRLLDVTALLLVIGCASWEGAIMGRGLAGESGQAGEGGESGAGPMAGTGGAPRTGSGGSGGSDGTGGRGAPDASVNVSPDADAPAVPVDAAPIKGACTAMPATKGPASKWVWLDASGKLAYAATPTGDKIMDFSYAGYHGGGVALPAVPAVQTLKPSGGDDTAAIQAALDAVAAMPLKGSFRGAVVLAPGTFLLDGSLGIRASGVVLRGAGSGAGGTLLSGRGMPRVMFTIGGSGSAQPVGTAANITDAYVPSGSRTFHVDDASAFKPGDPVQVGRPVTATWIHFMGMDTLVRNGAPQTWINAGSVIKHDRVIAAVNGNEVTIDAPLSDSLDAQFVKPPGATLAKYSFPGRISEVGLEGLHVVVPGMATPINQATFKLLNMNATSNGWLKDIVGEGFVNGLAIGGGTKWITVQEVSLVHTADIDGSAGYPGDFETSGTQNLFLRCSTVGTQAFPFATLSETSGPNVVLQLNAKGKDKIQPHMRWATGLLVDSTEIPMGSIDFINRGTAGSGHGWAIGWAVAWNSNAGSLNIQQPPGAQNWAIGSSGAPGSSTGIIDSPAARVAPDSLYLRQLCERLGPQALAAIGY
jgi:hypothetical protein